MQSLFVQSLLQNVKKSDVFTDPFPHIVIRDVLDENLCAQLIEQYPSLDTITQGAQFTDNERFSYPARDVFENPQVSELWKEFIRLHTSDLFLHQFINVFEAQIRELYPNFEQDIGALRSLKAGVRKINDFSNCDVLTDAQICINAPATQNPTLIKQAHIDRRQVFFVGLYYLRHSDDQSTGGDLDLYRFKRGTPYGFKGQFIDDQYVERVKTVKYERNVLVLFLNSIHSLHGVTLRSKTETPRCFVNLIGEVNHWMYDYGLYQEKESLVKKFSRKLSRMLG